MRTDVVLRDREGIPIAVYDLKTGNARLSPREYRKSETHSAGRIFP